MPDQGTNDALLTSDAFSQNPYPVYDQLRKEKPVYWSNAVGAWWLTCIAGSGGRCQVRQVKQVHSARCDYVGCGDHLRPATPKVPFCLSEAARRVTGAGCPEGRQRHGANPIRRGIRAVAGMHDVQSVELEIRERRAHRGGDLGHAGALDLEPKTMPAETTSRSISAPPACARRNTPRAAPGLP